MGQIAGGMQNILRATNENTRASERLNAQWRAIGTTIRYAIAGTAIFGLTRMVGQLKDVQTQLGLISSLGSQAGPGGASIGFSNRQVTQLGNDLQRVAINTITPVNEINDAAINLLSTIQNVKPSDVPNILTSIAQAAKLAQTPIEDLTQAATTMNIAFGRNNTPQNIAQFTRMWTGLIGLAPGGIQAAPELAKQLPNISTVFQQGLSPNVNPRIAQAQMMSLVLGSLRFGATPATASRGLAYFIQSLETPASAPARKALSGIGITPQTVRQQGIYATVLQFLRHIQGGNMSQAQLTALQKMPDESLDENMNIPGVAPNRMQFLRTALGRIHAVRAAIVLASQLQPRGGVASLQKDLNDMLGYQTDQLRDVHNQAVAWQRFRDRAKLQQASVAINTMALQVAQIFEPILNFAAGKVTGLAQVAQRHRGVTTGVVGGIAGALALLGIARGVGLTGRGRGVGRALVGANAIQAAISGDATLGASPQNPVYVVVVGQIFGGGPGWLRRVEKTAETTTEAAGAGGGAAAGSKGLRALLRRGVGLGGRAARVPGVGMAARVAGPAAIAAGYFMNADDAGGSGDILPENYRYQDLRRAQAIFGNRVIRESGTFFTKDRQGRGVVYMTIDIRQPDGKIQRKRVKVPVDMWSSGRFPSSKGNAANSRGT